MTDDGALLLSRRISQLFRTFHARSEPEQAVVDVARAVSAIANRVVSAKELQAMRTGICDSGGTAPEERVLAAVAQHFQVPAEYLLGDIARVTSIDQQLRLLEAARNAGLGVDDLRICGEGLDIEELIRVLAGLADDSVDQPGASS